MTSRTRSAVSGRPATWLPLRAFNTFADLVPRRDRELVGLGTTSGLHAAAQAQAGAADFGDPSYREGLERLHAALADEADLTPAGRFFARGAIVNALANRLRVEQSVAADPQITARPVGPALVVVGLPRSGTTLLQNLLALDPSNRSLRGWEAAAPAPPPMPDAGTVDPRLRAARRRSGLVNLMAPAVGALHRTAPHLPTECVTLFANSFASLELATIYQVPSYLQWCLSAEMGPHYAYYVRQLQVLGRHDHRERWALKSPAHLFWIPQLLTALPEARIVQLHRDPVQAVASFCSLASVLSSTNSRGFDSVRAGTLWSRAWADALGRAARARRDVDERRWVDLQYTNLVADPARSVRELYAMLGLPFTADFSAAICAYLADPRHTKGGHAYAPADFGLEEQTLRARFDAATHERPVADGVRP